MAKIGSRSLASDRRGAIATEYVTLLGLCAIAIAVAVVGWGPPLVRSYSRTRAVMVAPTP
jgi:Flp pilus assembly pilin Flp